MNKMFTFILGMAFLFLPACVSGISTSTESDLLVQLVKKVNASVVGVQQKVPSSGTHSVPPGEIPEKERAGQGSGFIISPDGFVVSNAHVVGDARELLVVFGEDIEYPAKVIGVDSKTDIALLKIIDTNHTFPVFPAVTFGNSDLLNVGEKVIAIGNPFGFTHTVTSGIVSGKSRFIGGVYDQFIQTDAAINPGNSGGPLFNIAGEVVGMNTAIISGQGGRGGNVGIGFAIPIQLIQEILTILKEKGFVERGFLGVMIQEITPDLVEALGLQDSHGALVAGVVPNGPAFDAGLKNGDVIVRFAGVEIGTVNDLPKIVGKTKPDTTVEIVILREGKEVTIPVTVALADTGVKARADNKPPEPPQTPQLYISPDSRFGLGVGDSDTTGEGVVVLEVLSDFAKRAGIKPGDIILEVNKFGIKSLKDFYQAEKESPPHEVLLLVRRGEVTRYIFLKY